MPTVLSRLSSRSSPGVGARRAEIPKFVLPLGPISLSWAMLSLFRSLQVRESVTVVRASSRFAHPPDHGNMYLLTLVLSAVRAFPNRSYTAANRGEMLFQFGMFGIFGSQNAPTKRPAALHPP